LSTLQDLKTFFISKYKWNNNTIDDIHWKSHGKAISALSGRRYKTTCQLIHKWLPVNQSYSKGSIGTAQLCPFCCSENEDQHHFLTCKHPELATAWQKTSDTIHSKLHKYNSSIHHHLLKLISLAITHWRTTCTPDTPTFLHPRFHHLFKSQAKIGWNQIINGRFSSKWIEAIASECSHPTNWLAYTISQIWHQTFEVWKIRCDKNHGTDHKTQHSRAILRLTPQIEAIYEQQSTSEDHATHLQKPHGYNTTITNTNNRTMAF
jgi:hypothetical protein